MKFQTSAAGAFTAQVAATEVKNHKFVLPSAMVLKLVLQGFCPMQIRCTLTFHITVNLFVKYLNMSRLHGVALVTMSTLQKIKLREQLPFFFT